MKRKNALQKYRELIMAVVFMAVFAILYESTYHIKAIASSDGLGPRFAPRVVLICMMGFTLIMIVRELIRLARGARASASSAAEELSETSACADNAEEKKDGKAFAKQLLENKGLISVVSLILYVLLLKPVGFVITSSAYVITQMFFFSGKEKRKPVLFVCLGIGLSLAIYLVFKKLMYIGLPSGILSFM